MKMLHYNWMNRVKETFLLLIITAVILLFTFPPVSPDYGPGLDTSYLWGLNWLFVHDYETLVNLIYPYGPLAFLRIPTYEGANLILFLIFSLLLKTGFVLLGFRAAGVVGPDVAATSDNFTRWFAPSVFLFAASYFANIDLLIVFNCLFLCLITLRERKWWSFVMASTLSVIAMFIKVSIGVNALSVVLVTIVISFMLNRNIRHTLLQLSLFLIVGLVAAFAILHHPHTVWHWLVGVFHLVFGYGSLSLIYDNNVFYIVLFWISTLLMMFHVSSQFVKYASVMLVIPLFAFWKHAIIREDAAHYFWLVFFMVVFVMVLALLEERRKMLVLLLGAVSILSLMLNATEMQSYDYKNKKEFCGVANFTKSYCHYRKLVTDARNYSEWLLKGSQLPDSMLQIIGNATIDVYPYEFTYAAQNKLNWQPRTALGNALSPWLEARSAENFSSGDGAARFVLMHFQDDEYGGKSVTLDNHYFLNDEPELMRNILSHYRLAAVSGHLMLLEHTGTAALGSPETGSPIQVRWGDWVEVPGHEQAVVRLKVQSRKTLWGKLKSAFYKEGICLVEYQVEDGSVYQYRYNPVFAEEGIWCSPFVRFPCDTVSEPDVVRVRLLTDDSKSQKPDLHVSFEIIPIIDTTRCFLIK